MPKSSKPIPPPLAALTRLVGSWAGPNVLWVDPRLPERRSDSVMVVGTKGNGRFVTFTYTWADDDSPHDGLIVFGFDDDRQVVTAHWFDSWHTGNKVMQFEGAAEAGGAVLVRGTYPAPTGPDWGWAIRIEPGNDAFQMIMHNVSPEGEEALAVDARYART